MELSNDANLSSLNRQEALYLWKKRNSISFAELGRKLGYTAAHISNSCAKETMPQRLHEQLVNLSVPAELLPTPVYTKPGPKPKNEAANAA